MRVPTGKLTLASAGTVMSVPTVMMRIFPASPITSVSLDAVISRIPLVAAAPAAPAAPAGPAGPVAPTGPSCPRVNVVSVALQLPVLTYRNAPVVFSAHTFTEVGAALAEIKPPMTDPRPTARPRTNTFPLNRLNRSINALLLLGEISLQRVLNKDRDYFKA